MRDRLIGLIRQRCQYTHCYGKSKTLDLCNKCDIGGEVADYLLANGVIVPPCNVGDTIYFIQDKKIYEGIVVLIRPFIHKDNVNFHGNVEYECEDPFYNDGRMMKHQISVVFQEYGQNTVAYFTRGEAERALRESKDK